MTMACYQASMHNGSPGSGKTGGGGFATEAECLQACQEGACCEGTTCTVKPQCQCQGAGKVFKGVGTVCTPNPCQCYCSDGTTLSAISLSATITGTTQNLGTGVYYRGWPSQTIKTKTYTLYKESCSRWTATIPTPPAALEGSTLSATSQLVFTTSPNSTPRFEIVVLHNVSGANLATYSIWQRFGDDADSLFCHGQLITSDLSGDLFDEDVVSIQAILTNPLP